MARLTPDKVRTEQGLTINEKIIPWGAVWPKSYGGFTQGSPYKADRKLSGGTGQVCGITIHNTGGSADAETYTRATWPNGNMKDVRVHYYVDDREAWQNLREEEVGWHAGDGRGGGNETTLSIEIIMRGSAIADDTQAEENGALLAALLLDRHDLELDCLYTHNHWMGHPDRITAGAAKNCPVYLLPHWEVFKAKVAAYLAQIRADASQQPPEGTDDHKGKTAIMGESEATAEQLVSFCRKGNPEPQLPACTLEELAEMFLEEGQAEGVRGDVAFAQSLLETGYYKYGGIVTPDMHNYAGIGALNGNSAGKAASFKTPREGVRAQIQHLKAYGSKEPLVNACVDPRFRLVTRGAAEFVEWLGAADNPNKMGWAVPGEGYGARVTALLEGILATTVPTDWQREGLAALAEAGILTDPAYWESRFDQNVTVGELMGLLGRLSGR